MSQPQLAEKQEAASRPGGNVWLTASAGTGKTQVLSARVLRLLLRDNRPEGILCLTFTKAGASEMQERIHATLGRWVTMPDAELAGELKGLGEDFGPETVARARRLFAGLLDARGAGLRVQTIHSFCESLLAGFPAEADLIPGFRAIDEREQALLHREALSDLIEAGDPAMIAALEALSLDPGEKATRVLLGKCAQAQTVLESLGSDLEARVVEWLGVAGVSTETLVAACRDCDEAALRRLMQVNIAWKTDTGVKNADRIGEWLARNADGRLARLNDILALFLKVDGEVRKIKPGQIKADASYPVVFAAQLDYFVAIDEQRRLLALSKRIADALMVGREFARRYAELKRRVGAVDFDDLIQYSVALLQQQDMGQWIRFKLDQATDHILIDEAQDTNASQWAIVKAIADEFFVGDGAREGEARTIFTVGDYKQAIFAFQGTDPRQFSAARDHFHEAARWVDAPFENLSLSTSFRTSQPVLDFVDAVIGELRHETMGLDRIPDEHVSHNRGSGGVTLWHPVTAADGEDAADEDEDEGDGERQGEESWISGADLIFADQLARRVSDWVNGGLYLENRGRPARAEDVLILLRSRAMAPLIVSRLHQAGVAVAGVDRLRLNAPIAVQDLVSCIRFVLQPGDDLNLAALLVSPIIGWTQDDLYAAGRKRPKGRALWEHLGEKRPAALRTMLAMADLTTPHRFLETILSGPIQARRGLIGRIGEEARDPIEALVNAALEFERDAPPSLQMFLDWFERGDVEIKRDAGRAENAVRVMTVHGAKGLQAPIVVIADAARDPGKVRSDPDWILDDETKVPLFRPRKVDQAGPVRELVEAIDARDAEEHWRLLYVAMTRAEERLFIGGVTKLKQGEPVLPGPKTWYGRIASTMVARDARVDEHGYHLFETAKFLGRADPAKGLVEASIGVPEWLAVAAPEEARPPRPLAPSALEAGDAPADAPQSPGMKAAADRGRWLHGLFERLPGAAPGERRRLADRWLLAAGQADAGQRALLIDQALTVIEHPDFAAIFSPDSLAEAPVAGVVDGRVIAGTVDRLCVTDDEVLVVDFKTGRRVPKTAEAAPVAHIAQMAAYVAVLSGIFPDKVVRAALLYSSGPTLLPVPPALIEAYKPGYSGGENNLSGDG